MNGRLEINYKTPKGVETQLISGDMTAEKAILIGDDLQRIGRLKDISFIDQREVTWTMKELRRFLEDIQTEPHNISVYFDGGYNVTTKLSGLGCAIYYEKNGKAFRLRKNAVVQLLDSNNEAEYAALYLGVQQLEELGVHHLPVKIIGDSQVVINQLKGEWACMEPALNSWADRIEDKMQKLGITPEYALLSRKENQEADKLASQALQEVEVFSTVELENPKYY